MIRGSTISALIALVLAFSAWQAKVSAVGTYPFSAAIFEPRFGVAGIGQGHESRLILFPLAGNEVTIPLPPGLPFDFAPQSSPDGRALYSKFSPAASRALNADGRAHTAATYSGSSTAGILRIDFKPVRASVVPGSEDFGAMLSVAIAAQPEIIYVYGWHRSQGDTDCGILELNPITGSVRPLRVEPDPHCAKLAAERGKNYYRHHSGLELINPNDKAIVTLDADLGGASWSPDGKWIAAISQAGDAKRVVLMDASDLSRRRDLGKTAEDAPKWSPDSRYLLLWRSGWRCGPDFGDLEVLDIGTGKRSEIKSSHCRSLTGSVGWVDNRVLD